LLFNLELVQTDHHGKVWSRPCKYDSKYRRFTFRVEQQRWEALILSTNTNKAKPVMKKI